VEHPWQCSPRCICHLSPGSTEAETLHVISVELGVTWG
jgi:hypothetical protein